MANVSISYVRDTINVSESDIQDAKLQKMVKRAEVTLELGRAKSLLADYLFRLKSKTNSLSRYKLARVS